MQGMGHMVHALYGWDWNSAGLFVCKGLLPPTIPLGTPSSSFAYFSSPRIPLWPGQPWGAAPARTQETLFQEVAYYQDPG